MENGAVCGVHRVGAVNAARADDADGRLLLFHRANLHGAGLRAQQHVFGEIERILGVPGRVALGHIEHFKIVVVQLHLGAGNDVEAHAQKNFLQLAQHLLERVALALRGRFARQRYVDFLRGQARGERRAFQLFGAARDIGCDGLAHLVGQRADDGPFLGGKPAHLL